MPYKDVLRKPFILKVYMCFLIPVRSELLRYHPGIYQVEAVLRKAVAVANQVING